jgi:DHA2 family multidrug resistance protein
MGSWTTETAEGVARIAREVNRQAAMLGYLNAFVLYTAMSMVAIPLVLMLGSQSKSAGAGQK